MKEVNNKSVSINKQFHIKIIFITHIIFAFLFLISSSAYAVQVIWSGTGTITDVPSDELIPFMSVGEVINFTVKYESTALGDVRPNETHYGEGADLTIDFQIGSHNWSGSQWAIPIIRTIVVQDNIFDQLDAIIFPLTSGLNGTLSAPITISELLITFSSLTQNLFSGDVLPEPEDIDLSGLTSVNGWIEVNGIRTRFNGDISSVTVDQDTDSDGVGNNTDTDDDNDGIPDSYEVSQGFDPLNPADAGQDFDSDSFSNLVEFRTGTNPKDNTSFPRIDNDIIVDFGLGFGLWILLNNSDWVKLHDLSPEEMVTGDVDGNGLDDIIIDFGPEFGLWTLLNNSLWEKLHDLSLEAMVTGDFDGSGQDGIIIDFGPGFGIWSRFRLSDTPWRKLHDRSPEEMVTGDVDGNGLDNIIIDFGPGFGLWTWLASSGWVQLHADSPEVMVTGDVDGNGQDDIITDFGSEFGILAWMNNSDWVKLHDLSLEAMVTGDLDNNGQDDIMVAFGPAFGLWTLLNNNDWVKLHTVSPETMVTGDLDSNGLDDIIIDFGPAFGLWVLLNNSSWVKLHTLSPESMVTGNVDGN